MSLSRIYQPVPLDLHTTIQLDEKARHHLAHVLRAKIGDALTLFNGTGGEYEAIVTHIDKKKVYVEIIRFVSLNREPPVDICLAQGIARGEKMDFIVQKAVELGVGSIVPLMTERSTVRLSGGREEKRLQHWQSVIMSACEQSGRNHLPDILPPVTMAEWLPGVKADRCFVLSPHVHHKLPSDQLPQHSAIALLIGPEGGLSEREIETASRHGFLPLNLGPRVLRTETAAIAALSVLQYCYGDFH